MTSCWSRGWCAAAAYMTRRLYNVLCAVLHDDGKDGKCGEYIYYFYYYYYYTAISAAAAATAVIYIITMVKNVTFRTLYSVPIVFRQWFIGVRTLFRGDFGLGVGAFRKYYTVEDYGRYRNIILYWFPPPTRADSPPPRPEGSNPAANWLVATHHRDGIRQLCITRIYNTRI